MNRRISTDNNGKAAIYCRVAANSAVLTDSNKSSADNQEAICREYATKKGYQINDVFIDFASGLTLERDGINSLIDAIKQNEIDAVIVKDFTRIARGIYEMAQFHAMCEEHGVNIQSAIQDISYGDSVHLLLSPRCREKNCRQNSKFFCLYLTSAGPVGPCITEVESALSCFSLRKN